MLARRSFLAILAASAACAATPPRLVLPSAGGDVWHRAQGARVTVYTNRGPDTARELVERFDTRYGVLAQVLFRGAEPPHIPSRIVAFKRPTEYRVFRADGPGHQLRPEVGHSPILPTVVTHGTIAQWGQHLWSQEILRHLLETSMGALPPYLSEGLASYYLLSACPKWRFGEFTEHLA